MTMSEPKAIEGLRRSVRMTSGFAGEIDLGDVTVGDMRDILAAYDALRSERDEERRELDDWREREASVCPEDVGFDEHILALRHRAERMERVVEAARRWADACATGDDDLEEDALRDAVRALDATPTREDE